MSVLTMLIIAMTTLTVQTLLVASSALVVMGTLEMEWKTAQVSGISSCACITKILMTFPS